MHTTRSKSRSAGARRRPLLEPVDGNCVPPGQTLGELAAVQEERRRIARELHDQMGQHVVVLSLGLARLASVTGGQPDASEIIRRLQEVADLLGRDVHRVALELRPPALDQFGLSVAIVNYAEETARLSGLDIDTQCHDIGGLKLAPVVETAVYRIAQEALTNVVKHARAQRVSVILKPQKGAVQLIVEDDGVGFEEDSQPLDMRERLGLTGIQERAASIGGTVIIESTVGTGTALYLRLPCPDAAGSP